VGLFCSLIAAMATTDATGRSIGVILDWDGVATKETP